MSTDTLQSSSVSGALTHSSIRTFHIAMQVSSTILAYCCHPNTETERKRYLRVSRCQIAKGQRQSLAGDSDGWTTLLYRRRTNKGPTFANSWSNVAFDILRYLKCLSESCNRISWKVDDTLPAQCVVEVSHEPKLDVLFLLFCSGGDATRHTTETFSPLRLSLF